MRLTEKVFWDDCWKNLNLPCVVDRDFTFDRCLAESLQAHIPALTGKTLEIGCAPGKWMAFMAREFGVTPSGIDYSEVGASSTFENLRMLGIEPGEVLVGDFFKIEPTMSYDLVMSLGFIEHFSDVEDVVRRHLLWLKPGGVLVLGIPNFQGVHGFLQKLLDEDVLRKHNTEIMNRKFFEQLAHKNNLEPLFNSYIGSFEPSLIVATRRSNTIVQLFAKMLLRISRRVRNLKLFDGVNGRMVSSYILAIYRKNSKC